MRKPVLITTGLEKTWFHDDVVFLGEWCKKYSNKKILDNLTHQTIEFHWSNRKKFETDSIYLYQLHEKLLTSLTDLLNDYHKVNYSLRYWRIIIGPWLSTFIPAVFDRWETIKQAFAFQEYNAVTLNNNIASDFINSDYQDFATDIHEDILNFIIFSDIVINMPGIPKYSATANIRLKDKLFAPNIKTTLPQKLIGDLDYLASKLQPTSKVALINSYIRPHSRLRLALKFRQLPRHYSKFKAKINQKNIIDEVRKLNLEITPKNNFEKYLKRKILQFIPYSYLEGFSSYKKLANVISENTKTIVTANDHISNDLFKIWCAEQCEDKKCKLIVGSHGGSFPSKISSFQQHEERVSDIRIVWHQALTEKQIKLPANKYLGIKRKRFKKRDGAITLIGGDCGRYTYGAQSGSHSSLMLKEIEQKKKFLSHLLIQHEREIKYYPYPKEAWQTSDRFSDIFGKNILSNYSNFDDVLSKSKIVICSYPQTTFADALVANVPTILLYKDDLWDFPKYFDPIIEEFTEAKILFTDPILAANHTNDIWVCPNEWWNSEIVEKAKKRFFEECVYMVKNGIHEWYTFLNRQI